MDADQQRMSVARYRPAAGSAAVDADIILDEQGAASGGRGDDAASRPLFRHVDPAELARGTYPSFVALLDNYVVPATAAESYSPQEQQEIDIFLDQVTETRPMQVARHYVTTQLGQPLNDAGFRAKLESIWFDLYDNHFGSRPTRDCSGFEHVFVGEGQYPRDGRPGRQGEISGYHSWIQFMRQESSGHVNYLGHCYDLPAALRPANPMLITLRMLWNHDPDGSGGEPAVELFKPKGGFFVGTSPAGELAMGTVAFFEHTRGLFPRDQRRAVIDAAAYDLVLYRNVTVDGQPGDHIRSFFPILVGHAQPVGTVAAGTPARSLAIARALPNPAGDDETGEWVEVANAGAATIDLSTWELRDRQGGVRRLQGSLASGASRRFDIPRDQHTLRLGNSGGTIGLYRSGTLVDEVQYDRTASGVIITFR